MSSPRAEARGTQRRLTRRLPSRDELLAERCRRKLHTFVQQAWPVVEPGVPFVDNWHIEVICEHLEAVSRGEIRKLVINQPPRTTKSLLVAVLWPAWEWLTRPEGKWLSITYAQTLTLRDSMRCRRLVQTAGGAHNGTLLQRVGYIGLLRLLGQSWTLVEDQNAKGRFENTRAGYRLATSVHGFATGEGGDRIVCLHGDTRVTTTEGPLAIADIVSERRDVRVLGSTGRWQRIERYESGPGRPMLEITTADGAVLRCTEDHPIYLEGHGWRPARAVTSSYGDLYMRCLRGPVSAASKPRRAQQDGLVLLAPLLRHLRASGEQSRVDGRPGRIGLPDVPIVVLGEALGGVTARPLLGGVLPAGRSRSVATGLPAMRGIVHPGAAADCADALQPRVRGDRASHDGPRDRQRSPHTRGLGDRVHAGLHGQVAGGDQGAGRQPLRGLRPDGLDLAGSSHRRLEGQSRSVESRDALPLGSPQNPHARRDQRSGDAPVRIVAVRRIGTPDAVYNLRVAPDHDYYAEGLLVHNCDDPHSALQARSEVERERTIEWYDATIPTRLNDARTSAQVVVMQRLHELDLTGHLLEQGGWEHLCLPATYEPDHPHVSPADRRTEPGETLDEVRLPHWRLADLLKTLGAYGFAGQLRQLPAPEEGGIIKKSWWRAYTTIPPVLSSALISWDLTFGSGNQSGSWNVGQAWGVVGPNAYLLDEVRDRWDFVDLLEAMREFAAKWPQARPILIENKAAGAPAIATLRREIPGLVAIDPTKDKVARAESVTPFIEGGNAYLPEWALGDPRRRDGEWVSEQASFPNGASNDRVDAMSQALSRIYLHASAAKGAMAQPGPGERNGETRLTVEQLRTLPM